MTVLYTEHVARRCLLACTDTARLVLYLPVLVRWAKIELPCPGGAVLVREVPIRLGDVFRLEHNVFVVLPFSCSPDFLGDLGLDGAVDDDMADVNVLLAEFLVQALAQASDSVLASCEGSKRCISTPCRRGGGEEEAAAVAELIDFVFAEGENGAARESKATVDVDVDASVNILLSQFKEWLADSVTRVVQSNTDLGTRPALLDVDKDALDL